MKNSEQQKAKRGRKILPTSGTLEALPKILVEGKKRKKKLKIFENNRCRNSQQQQHRLWGSLGLCLGSVSPCFVSGYSELLFSAVYSIQCHSTTSFHFPFTLSSKHCLPPSSHLACWKNASPTKCLSQQLGLKAETNPAHSCIRYLSVGHQGLQAPTPVTEPATSWATPHREGLLCTCSNKRAMAINFVTSGM